jgi:hypothetical protein
MSASRSAAAAEHGVKVPWSDVLLSAIAAVSWALIGMAGTAALGLHLLEADGTASLGPMTAAVVALGAGGSVTPSGDVSAFGLAGAEARTAIEIAPLGVSLVGALLLSFFFLRSLRAAGVVVAPAELAARAGAVVVLFTAMTGGLAWAGHDVITIDGGSLGVDDLPGGGSVDLPGVGDIGGLLPDRLGDLVDAQAAVGFTVDTVPTLLGGLGWSAGVLLIALLASRRTPLPRGWDAVHRVVRPVVSAVVAVAVLAVVAGLAAAAYAAIGDDHPRRIAGAALLGAPNGVWLGVPLGLFVPWDGRATGALAGVLPDPLDDLLRADAGEPVTLGRLAELDSRVWLLAVAAALVMLLAGVLTAVRTPVAATGAVREGVLGFAGRCALRLGIATALALPLLAWLTEVSVDASLSVLGVDAFGGGIVLRGDLGMALLLGAVWGAGAGAAGALLVRATGAAGRWAAPLARGAGVPGPASAAGGAGRAGRAGRAQYVGGEQGAAYFGERAHPSGAPGAGQPPYAGRLPYSEPPPYSEQLPRTEQPPRTEQSPFAEPAGQPGPYRPGAAYPPPNPDTNPYLRPPVRPPDRPPGSAGARRSDEPRPYGTGPAPGEGHDDVYGAPTVAGPVVPPKPPPRQPRPQAERGEGPPPPTPPPPPPPRRPRGPEHGE